MNMENLDKWWKDSGDTTHRLDYALDENSLVYDVGGYEGNWAASIIEKYNPYMFVFEPVLSFFLTCQERFKDNPKVCVLNYGLSNKNEKAYITLACDSTSLHKAGDDTEEITLKDAADVIVRPVDLIGINIEGEEYSLLLHMLDSGVAKHCQNIQVQFHDFFPGCEELRDEIRKGLAETHTESFCYPFVWEGWKRSVQA